MRLSRLKGRSRRGVGTLLSPSRSDQLKFYHLVAGSVGLPNLSHRRVGASWKLGWCRKHRNLDVRIAGLHGHRRPSRPSHLQGKMIEHHAGPAFGEKTFGSHTTKKNAALRCVKEKKFGRRIKLVRVSYFDSSTSL